MAVIHRIYAEKLGASSAGTFIGNHGEIFYDPSTLTLRISDGVTPGGRLIVGGASSNPTAADVLFAPTGDITTSTVQAALAEVDSKKLATAGGTMTGDLILNGTPATSNSAISKGYMESFVANTISSGGITGNNVVFDNTGTTLTSNNVQGAIAELDATKLSLSGGALTGPVTSTQTVFANNELVTASYVASLVNSEDTFIDTAAFDAATGFLTMVNNDGGTVTANFDGRYLKLTGGTMTGELLLAQTAPTSADSAISKGYMESFVANTISSGIDANNIVFNNGGTTLTSNTVQDAIAELDLDKVNRAGDTMTGFLTLYADPIAPLHAATKDYVDSAVTSGSGASLLDELLDVNATAPIDGQVLAYDGGLTRYTLQTRVKNSGDTMTGFLTLHADPTNPLHAVTKQYVDAVTLQAVADVVNAAPVALDTLNELAAALGDDPNFATTMTTALGGKLDLTGGTMTGPIILDGGVPTDPNEAVSLAYVTEISDSVANLHLNDLVDTNIDLLLTSGQSLVWNGSAWINARQGEYVEINSSPPSAINSYNVNGDLYIRTSNGTSSGDWLGTYVVSDSGYVKIAEPTNLGNTSITAFADVNTTGVTNGQVLSWNGTEFVPFSLPPGTTDTFVTSGAVDANGIITFTKNDSSTFNVDISGYSTTLGGLSNVDSEVDDSHSSRTFLSYSPLAGRWVADSASIDWLSDVAVSGANAPANGQALVWDSTVGFSGSWVPGSGGASTLGALTDVNDNVNLGQNKQVLRWNSTNSEWEFGWPEILLSASATASTEYAITLQNGTTAGARNVYINSGFSYNPGANTLTIGAATISDTDIASWNAAVGSPTIALNDLTDVNEASPVVGDFLRYNGSAWTGSQFSATLLSLSDTNITSVSDGQVLAYDQATAKWVNADNNAGYASLTNVDPTATLGTNYPAGAIMVRTSNGTLAGDWIGSYVLDGFRDLWLPLSPQRLNDIPEVNTTGLADGDVLSWDSATSEWVSTSGGNVSGPSSSTDNAIARYDATTGKLIQNSAAFVDDTGAIDVQGIYNGRGYAQEMFINSNLNSGVWQLDFGLRAYQKVTVTGSVSTQVTNQIGWGTNNVWSLTMEAAMNGGSITWASNIKWPGGTAPTLADGKTHLIMFTTSDNGTTVLASYLEDYTV